MVRNPPKKEVVIKDSTLREGLDTPNVNFTMEQKLKIAELLDHLKVPEIEIIAPGRVIQDLELAERLFEKKLNAKTSGLVYAYSPEFNHEIMESAKRLHRFDILLPVSAKRPPYDYESKKKLLAASLDFALGHHLEVGVGFPHSTQMNQKSLIEIAKESDRLGAKRITIYDTNGSADPFQVYELIKQLKDSVGIDLWFHGHNDLGLATANSISAILAGASGIDATINGLGDRAGNASLEQIAVWLKIKGIETGMDLIRIESTAQAVGRESGVPVPKLAPVVGEYAYSHKSLHHLNIPELFEAFDPSIVGRKRESTKL
jgi:homocitrate synthase NifV